VEYFDNPSLSGVPKLVEDVTAIRFNWGDGRPGPGLPADGFGLRVEGYVSAAQAGDHGVDVSADGGARLWIGGRLISDEWDASQVDLRTTVSLPAGAHRLSLMYQDPAGPARLSLTWSPVGGVLPTATRVLPTPTRTNTPRPTATRRAIVYADLFLPVGYK
jgi:hypothetical protein